MEYEYGACRAKELPGLVELANRIFRAGGEGDMAREYPLVFEAQNLENLRVARHGGRIVSHVGICFREASILGARLRVASIGAVGTDPEHRGHGIASRLMEDARRRAVEQGASLMLISGGRGLYHRLGYVEVGAFERTTIPAGDVGSGYLIDALGTEDAAAVARLYQREPVRFLRPLSDWRKLLAAGMLMNRRADLVAVRRGETMVAYAGVQQPAAGRASDAPSTLRIREAAGSRAGLAAALPGIARRYGLDRVEVILCAEDLEWRAEAAARAWLRRAESFPGTLGIIDAPRFLRAVKPLIDERSGAGLEVLPDGAGALLTCRGESARLDSMGQLTAVVFGGETGEARALPDLSPGLRSALTEALPLPLLWYGYNYV